MVYELIFDMVSPIITGSPLHFDAILMQCHPATHNQIPLSKNTPISQIKQIPLPIDSVKKNATWCYCCSSGAYAETAQPFSDKISRRKTDYDVSYLRGNHTKTNGIHKDVMKTIYGVVTPYIKFYVATHNLKELKRIAGRIKAIGAFSKLGYGEIRTYNITEFSNDFTQAIIGADNRAIRNLPIEIAIPVDGESMVPTKPPYWHPSMIVKGIAVGSLCTLKDGVILNVAQ